MASRSPVIQLASVQGIIPSSFESVLPAHALVLKEQSLVAERARCQLSAHPDVSDVLFGATIVPVSWLVPGPHLEQGSTILDPHQLILKADSFTDLVGLLLTAKKISDLSSGDVEKLERSHVVLNLVTPLLESGKLGDARVRNELGPLTKLELNRLFVDGVLKEAESV